MKYISFHQHSPTINEWIHMILHACPSPSQQILTTSNKFQQHLTTYPSANEELPLAWLHLADPWHFDLQSLLLFPVLATMLAVPTSYRSGNTKCSKGKLVVIFLRAARTHAEQCIKMNIWIKSAGTMQWNAMKMLNEKTQVFHAFHKLQLSVFLPSNQRWAQPALSCNNGIHLPTTSQWMFILSGFIQHYVALIKIDKLAHCCKA